MFVFVFFSKLNTAITCQHHRNFSLFQCLFLCVQFMQAILVRTTSSRSSFLVMLMFAPAQVILTNMCISQATWLQCLQNIIKEKPHLNVDSQWCVSFELGIFPTKS